MKRLNFLYRIRAVIVLLIVLANNMFAQETERYLNENGLCFSVVPHYILTSTFKTEIDKQINKSGSWLSLSALYADREDDFFWGFNFTSMITYGVSLSYRYYFFSKDEPKWLYVQSGLVYNNTEVHFDDERWDTYNYNGMEAVRLTQQNGSDKIHQYGADFKVGGVLKINRFLFFDIYVGFGLRNAYVMGVELENPNYGQEILAPAYVGALPVLGVRFGVNL